MTRRKMLFPLLLWIALVFGVLWTWHRFGESTMTTVLTLLSTLAALAPLLPAWPWKWAGPAKPSTREQITSAAEALTWAVRMQWDEESRRRRIEDAPQMPIRWHVESAGSHGSTWPQHGELEQLIDTYTADPQRVVVVGDPGSGKTGLCVLLTLDLLNQPSQERVPVLLRVSSWHPREHFDAWVVRRLIEDYPFLGDQSRFGATVAADLFNHQRVLPILDGLDEMPDDHRAEALRAMEDDAQTGQPFVLTCRTDEFAAPEVRHALHGAVVVRLSPLDTESAADYLVDAVSGAEPKKWQRLLGGLTSERDGPLGSTLTKPLMLFLARTAYERPGATPGELLDRDRFDSGRAIEEHLLDTFIPTVFHARPPGPSPSPTRPSRRWDPGQAQHWLTFLARHMRALHTRDLAWWRLDQSVPRRVFLWTRTVLGGVACGLLGWVMFGLFGRPAFGVVFGLVVGVVASLPLGAVHEKQPRRFVPRLLRKSELSLEFLLRDLGFGVVGALVGGLIVGLLWGVGYGIAIGLVFGVAFGVVRRFTEPTEPKKAVSPMGVLAGDRAAVWYGTLLGGVVGAAVGGFMGGVVGAGRLGLVVKLGSSAAEGALGATVGFLLGASGLGMLVHATSAWGRLNATRPWLAFRNQTPLRLMTFLDDAHRLGVLRQVGPYYQFRHALLQDRLLSQHIDPVEVPKTPVDTPVVKPQNA